MESQIIELLGRNRLIDDLLRAGLEVALPIRDRGIDLIVYADLGLGVAQFAAVPIQMKASSKCAFSLDAKYSKFPNLLIAHIWHIDSPKDEVTYAMNYDEALAVAEVMGWIKNPTWVKGYYANNNPGAKLRSLLEPHRMTAEKWRQKVIGVAHRSA
jgi:hypothetical protein